MLPLAYSSTSVYETDDIIGCVFVCIGYFQMMHKNGTYICIDRAMGYVWKRSASIIATVASHVEHKQFSAVGLM